jgi:hypothetical protein
MFNYSEGLQNPELTIRRLMARETGTPIETRDIFKMLHKATGTTNIQLTAKGVRIDGPWGNGMPLRDLADGYKSAVLWVTDLVGWALAFKPRLKGPKGIRGIVLVDELEQHLHARWQRTIVDDLWRVFPNIQFLVTSHSPLIASSVGPRLKSEQADKLYVLEAMPCNRVQAARQEFMQGWRMDQVLASRAFKYQVHSDPETRKVLREGSKLAAKRSRTPEEEATYRRIRKILDKGFFSSTTPVEREGETKAKKELRKEIQSLERELFGDKAS